MTSPARELITRLSFTFDRTNLDRFLTGIRSFRLQAVAIAAGVAVATQKLFSHFQDLASTTLRVNDIAKAAGFASTEFAAMRDAAAGFGIATENFDADFVKLTKAIQQARLGSGELFRLFIESGKKVRLPSQLLSQAENFRNVIQDIFNYVDQLPTEADKLYVLGNIFSVESAGRWLGIIKQGFGAFDEAVGRNRQQNIELEKQVNILSDYNNKIGEFSARWTAFSRNVQVLVIPALNTVLDIANKILTPPTPEERAKSQVTIASENSERIRNQVINFASNLGEYFSTAGGRVSPNRLMEENQLEAFQRTQTDIQKNFSSPYEINNEFTFNVPLGTTETQAIYMTERLRESFDLMMGEKTREIITNNPQME